MNFLDELRHRYAGLPGWAWLAVVAFIAGGGLVICTVFLLRVVDRDSERRRQVAEARNDTDGPGAAEVARQLEDARKSRAQLQCKTLGMAVDSYYLNPMSNNQYPESLGQLLNPPFGGGPFLKNGQEDLIDPWGHLYQLQFVHGQDGAQMPLIHTTAKDGTPISQYGVGPLSKMQ